MFLHKPLAQRLPGFFFFPANPMLTELIVLLSFGKVFVLHKRPVQRLPVSSFPANLSLTFSAVVFLPPCLALFLGYLYCMVAAPAGRTYCCNLPGTRSSTLRDAYLGVYGWRPAFSEISTNFLGALCLA